MTDIKTQTTAARAINIKPELIIKTALVTMGHHFAPL